MPNRQLQPSPAAEAGGEPPVNRKVDAVLFDFHGTLATTVDPVSWVTAAATACGVELERMKATVLADRIATAGGLPGVSRPRRVPPGLAEVWANRDLYEYAHRAAYVGLTATVPCDVPGLAEAVYERTLRPEGWLPYPDVRQVLDALRAVGVKLAVVSNVGFDIRPILDSWQLSGLLDAVVLSYEVGYLKPDPAIFLRACGLLGVEPERVLMVGDTADDAGAVSVGCAALVMPSATGGRPNGLHRVIRLAGAESGLGQ